MVSSRYNRSRQHQCLLSNSTTYGLEHISYGSISGDISLQQQGQHIRLLAGNLQPNMLQLLLQSATPEVMPWWFA